VRFTNWMPLDAPVETGTIPHDDSSVALAGRSTQSVLSQADVAQGFKDDILLHVLLQSHLDRWQKPINLPYFRPFNQVHCTWRCPGSSARAIPVSPIRDFATYSMISNSSVVPDIPPYVIEVIHLENGSCNGSSSVFTIQPGKTSIWCGVWPDSRLMLMFSLLYMRGYTALFDGHLGHVECKLFPVAMRVAETNSCSIQCLPCTGVYLCYIITAIDWLEHSWRMVWRTILETSLFRIISIFIYPLI
jgi:hypothetical protein